MRRKFIQGLVELARKDKRVVLLTADLGYTVVEPFQEEFPERFVNVGVAEQNMIGIATGLAESGFVPFAYSIGTFATARAYEFIRNGPILHRLKVRIIGVGGGYEYGSAGFSHHVLDDVGLMMLHRGITVVTPCDAGQAVAGLKATWDVEGPVYYRVGKDENYALPGVEGRFEVGTAQLVKEGERVLVVAMGAVAREAAAAVEMLEKQGKGCGLMVVSCLQPAPLKSYREVMGKYKSVVTVEAHGATGGLRSQVGAFLAEEGIGGGGVRLVSRSVSGMPDGMTGSEGVLLKRAGLDAGSLAGACAEAWGMG